MLSLSGSTQDRHQSAILSSLFRQQCLRHTTSVVPDWLAQVARGLSRRIAAVAISATAAADQLFVSDCVCLLATQLHAQGFCRNRRRARCSAPSLRPTVRIAFTKPSGLAHFFSIIDRITDCQTYNSRSIYYLQGRYVYLTWWIYLHRPCHRDANSVGRPAGSA